MSSGSCAAQTAAATAPAAAPSSVRLFNTCPSVTAGRAPGTPRYGERLVAVSRAHAHEGSEHTALLGGAGGFRGGPPVLLLARAHRTQEHPEDGPGDPRGEPPELPRPLHRWLLHPAPGLLRCQERTVREALAGLGPEPPWGVPDQARRGRRGVDGDRARRARTGCRSRDLPGGHAHP